MDDEQARAALARLIAERREDFSSLSRMIGRNPAYVQQYVRRGVPRRLDEGDRRTLARYFGVPEQVLGADGEPDRALVTVPRLDVGASAGPGALGASEPRLAPMAFDPDWLREIAPGASAAKLSMIRVDGESMRPTLSHGDEILVDQGDAAARLRDGIYVIRAGEVLIVKRIARHPNGRVCVRSDNRDYPDWDDYDPATMRIVGRVIWAARRLG